jgi:hypothetical protein
VLGDHTACGIRPYHESKFKEASLELRADLFEPKEVPSKKVAE